MRDRFRPCRNRAADNTHGNPPARRPAAATAVPMAWQSPRNRLKVRTRSASTDLSAARPVERRSWQGLSSRAPAPEPRPRCDGSRIRWLGMAPASPALAGSSFSEQPPLAAPGNRSPEIRRAPAVRAAGRPGRPVRGAHRLGRPSTRGLAKRGIRRWRSLRHDKAGPKSRKRPCGPGSACDVARLLSCNPRRKHCIDRRKWTARSDKIGITGIAGKVCHGRGERTDFSE